MLAGAGGDAVVAGGVAGLAHVGVGVARRQRSFHAGHFLARLAQRFARVFLDHGAGRAQQLVLGHCHNLGLVSSHVGLHFSGRLHCDSLGFDHLGGSVSSSAVGKLGDNRSRSSQTLDTLSSLIIF